VEIYYDPDAVTIDNIGFWKIKVNSREVYVDALGEAGHAADASEGWISLDSTEPTSIVKTINTTTVHNEIEYILSLPEPAAASS